MADIFADRILKQAINRIIDNKDNIKTDFYIWKQMTKCLIRQIGIFSILEEIEKINLELADKDWFENKYPPEIFKEKKERKQIFKTDNRKKNLINTKLKITDIAKRFGLNPDRRGKCQCPFHYDNDPSLSLDNNRNVFHCFGCGAKGDIITFIKKMEENKKNENQRINKKV